MSKSNSDDAFVGSSVGVGVDESTATLTGVDAVVVVKKKASASDCVTVPDGGLGALSFNEAKQWTLAIINILDITKSIVFTFQIQLFTAFENRSYSRPQYLEVVPTNVILSEFSAIKIGA